ncbi:allophanate hydrolase subunit 1 [Plantibacter flavus]
MGEHAVLLELASLDEVLRVHRALDESRPRGLVDLVPAAATVLAVSGPDGPALAAIGSWLLTTAEQVLAAHAEAPPVASDDDVVIPVRYDGQDLDDTAELLGLGVDALVALHTSSVWTVGFSGFAPGFGYLVTDHERLVVPRLRVPRTVVPAGSVALAGAFSGVYPRASPGGWRLIGTTDAVLWDAAAERPALLAPGLRVRFEAVAG